MVTPEQVIELLGGEFARAGNEIEEVVIDTSGGGPPRITVIADGDTPLDLDAVAALSRSASELLDTLDGLDSRYVLDVSSPGVERPLTTATHFRRAQGRKADLTLIDGSQVTGRLGACDDTGVRLVVRERGRQDWSVRDIPLDTVVKAVVQVEFSPPTRRELELAGRADLATAKEVEV